MAVQASGADIVSVQLVVCPFLKEKQESIIMCGIVGYTGDRQAAPILLEGLTRLEYRGYDSAGIAVRN